MSEQIYDRLYIGGEWVVPHSGRAIASIDPSTEAVWAEVAEADEQDIDKAVEARRVQYRGLKLYGIIAAVDVRGALADRVAHEGLYLATASDDNFRLVKPKPGFKPKVFTSKK